MTIHAPSPMRALLPIFIALLCLLALAPHACAQEGAPQVTVRFVVAPVRSGPGAIHPIIGRATLGQRYTVTGRDAVSQWWQVDFGGKPGWIYAHLVDADAAAASVKVTTVVAAPAAAKTPAATPAAAKAPAAAPTAAKTTTLAGQPLPSYQESVTLGDGTTYPLRGHTIAGWGYELVDESQDFDVLLNRDIFGVFLNRLSPDLLKTHPKGVRVTFRDAEPGIDYPARYRHSGGFGDGESAYVVVHPCATTHEEHNKIWPNEQVSCDVTLVAPGPGLTDITVAATALGFARSMRGDNGYTPVYSEEPFGLLGRATREAESGQWRWIDPFLQVVSLKPVAAAAPPAAAPAAKGPLPPATGHIAFTRTRDLNGPTPAGLSDIAVVDVRTGEVRVVAQNGRQPDMRNDGRIVFNGEGGGRDDLQVVQPDGGNLAAISMHPEDSAPAWSGGNSLAFHSTLAGGTDRIFVQWNGDQRAEPQYLEIDNGANLGPFTGRYPVWVGGRIAYSGCNSWATGSACGIYIVDVDALMRTKQAAKSGMLLLTQQPQDRPTDVLGDTILFSSLKTGDWDVFTVPATGGKARNLTNSLSLDLGGAYSPDGNYIAFMSNRDGWGIWVMEADGANPRLLVAVPEGFGKLWDQDRLSWGP